MIWIFAPVNNPNWFDIREFEIVNWKPTTYKWVSIEKYYNSNLPIYRTKHSCSLIEYYEQFKEENFNIIKLF